jgi:hypothetical protein
MGVLNDKTRLDLPVTGGPKSTHAQVKEIIKVRAMTPEQRALRHGTCPHVPPFKTSSRLGSVRHEFEDY